MLRAFLLLAAAPALAAEPFSYAGIGLDATATSLRPAFPNSKFAGDYVQVADKDSHDHVYGIALPGAKRPRTVRVSFERPGGSRPRFPKCKVVEARLRAGFGAPNEIRKLAAERVPRADRVWKGARETMTLVCVAGPNGELLAEAVVIAEK
ncbi:MAG TPA: hypothetical protein VML91_22410 [Burkholderiales bacterium]|nr:hypothetical protein [Burkholderiales bacterium]